MPLHRNSRRAIRFPLDVTTIFYWSDRLGVQHQAEGRVRDVSEHGAFISSLQYPPAGGPVLLRIFLQDTTPEAPAVLLSMEARVVRTEGVGGGNAGGFAVEGRVRQVKDVKD